MTIDEKISQAKPIAEALLPPGSTAIEKALLTAEIARLAMISPEVIATIWNPWTCPAELLPWLAWAISVDNWDRSWPEQTKRKVIAAAPLVHRLKGVRSALEAALQALDITFTLTEWWQKEPIGRRGTFEVEFPIGELPSLPGKAKQASLKNVVQSSKPKSRSFSLSFGIPVVVEPKLSALAMIDVSEGHLAEVTDECSLNLPFASAAWGESEEESGVVRDDLCADLPTGAAFYGEIEIAAMPPQAA